jgi:hypothetical protein
VESTPFPRARKRPQVTFPNTRASRVLFLDELMDSRAAMVPPVAAAVGVCGCSLGYPADAESRSVSARPIGSGPRARA